MRAAEKRVGLRVNAHDAAGRVQMTSPTQRARGRSGGAVISSVAIVAVGAARAVFMTTGVGE